MKMVKVRYRGLIRPRRIEFWVKETNPYFEWYLRNPFYKIVKEKIIGGEKDANREAYNNRHVEV